MPVVIRTLAHEEAQHAFPHRGQQDLSEYLEALRGLEPGHAAGIECQGLADGVIKRRLGQAAKDLGYRLKRSRHATADMLYVRGQPRIFRSAAETVEYARVHAIERWLVYGDPDGW